MRGSGRIIKRILLVTVLAITAVLHIEPLKPSYAGAGVRPYITVAPLRTPAYRPVKDEMAGKRARFKITAYCPCELCSEGYGRQTSTGVTATEGRTVAVDPEVIPYGTRVHIKGLGDFVAEDCGGKVKGNHIDIYFESHEETVEFGVKYKKVERG